MDIQFKIGETKHIGLVSTIENDREFQYLVKLAGIPAFTIYLSEDGNWESDNKEIDPAIVLAAGERIENMEDLNDVLAELDQLRQ
jgi:hypothetical protein